ncbi:alpha-2-macroglobulin family protein [Massilia glaciei]|uniref:Alpha-2-macroglobulin family protein n=1 Tax=Massilia glaciei TaxID=1524097 RepID=A0A2U2H9T9_9BURK|nr:alpha-2-macroglobulin [Massilia glaciei]PWF39409.1 alpha-2-macroglobulin family protein [Massilia glaciei]
MNKLNAAVARFAIAVWAGMLLVLRPAGRILAALFGSWQAPAWAPRARARLAPSGRLAGRQPAALLLAVLIGLGVLAAPMLKNVDWQARFDTLKSVQPDRPAVLASDIVVTNPARTAIEDNGKPHPAVLTFQVSAAPLSQVGKEAADIGMAPALAGKWTWASATRLEFTPAEDWPVGVVYQVTLGAKSLAPHVKADRAASFSSPGFVLTVGEASFYQDPVQLNLRKAVFAIGFSHPVDPDSLERRLKLALEGGAGLFAKPGDIDKLTVTYDKLRLNATVHSEPLAIPADTVALKLTVGSGVKAQRGGQATGDDSAKALAIPGLYNLDVAELNQLIVTNDSGEPENILQITTGMPVHEKEMARAVNAWLLPLKRPGADADDADAKVWSDPASVTDAVLAQSAKVPLLSTPAEREIREGHAFKFVAEPGRYLLVRIQKGLKSAGGYQLGAARDEVLRVKRSAPELSIMSKGSLLALSGEKKLPLLLRDLPGVRIEIGRLLPQQLQHLVTQSDGDMTKPEFYAGITPDSLTERFEREIALNLKPGKTHYEAIDFSDYLRADSGERRGIFIVTAQGYDPANKSAAGETDQRRNDHEYEGDGEGAGEGEEPEVDPGKMRDRRLVIVTDLGIVSKKAVDGARDVYVQSIHDGSGTAGASVEVWGKNGAILVSKLTDATGVARLPTLAAFTREKSPAVMVVRKDGDMSFLPLNRDDRTLDVSRFDVGGIHASEVPNQVQAYLFSDRGIYRPGDTINVGIVAKSMGWNQKLADLPVEAEVIDARGLVVRRQKFKLGAGGMAEFSHATQDSSPTGNFTINLNLGRDTGSATPGTTEAPALQLGTLTVKVQEFMPDRTKVTARLSRQSDEGWVTPQELGATVNVQNLFGTPAPQRRVEAQLTLSPAHPSFASHPGYAFFDPARANEKFQDTLAVATTDAQGNATLPLGLQRYAQATYQLHLLVKAFEPEGGRSVAAEAAALVSDRPYLVGYKTDGELGYVGRNSVRNVSFIAIDPKAKRVAVDQLRLLRIERRVVSVLTKQHNGLYKYESRGTETVLGESAFAIAAGGAKTALSTQTPGNFSYALRDARGLTLARVDYSVAGTGNVSRTLDRNAELQMSLSKKDYAPGEEIEMSIRAPYTGAGLITIERDRVYAHKWFRAGATASVQKIALPKDFEGNGYVSVQFARDIGSDEIYMSPMSHGVVPFVTSLARRTNPVVLKATPMVKPGQPVKITLTSKAPARAIVFAVDEGILQVARYQAPDPLKFFFQKRALEVSTQQTLDLILPEFKKLMGAAAPGGDAEGMLGKNLNPFKRKTDKPVVWWSGIVEVDGTREFSYTPPENFNGSLRVMAIVINEDTAASAATATTVRGDLILLPNVPIAMTPGDEVEIGVGVANNTKGSGQDAPVTLTLSVSAGLEVVGGAQQALKISERSEGSAKFIVRAKAADKAVLGPANVVFTAKTGVASARLSTGVSVRPASAYVTLVQTGLFKGSGSISAQGDMYPNLKRSVAAVSPSPWAFTSGMLQYLEVYPHGCTEQITSQTFPAVVVGTQPALAAELLKRASAGASVPDPAKTLERYLALVRARQGADGGFAAWPGGPSDLFSTTYVANLLVEAKERHMAVPNDLLSRANGFMQNKLVDAANHSYEWRTQAYAAYLLTRQGVVTTAALTNLREAHRKNIERAVKAEDKQKVRRDLGAVYLAASYQLQKQEQLARELADPAFSNLRVERDHRKSWHWEYYYDPLVHDAVVVALMARHFPSRIAELPKNHWERMARVVRDGYYQSHSAASIMLSVDAYARAASQSAAGKVGMAAIDAKGVATALAIPAELALAKFALPPGTAKVRLTNDGELPLFYSWAESGYERALPKEAKSQGMEIIHEFLDAAGKVVTEAKLGEEITVRVRVRALDRPMLAQVALVDLLPGGLEPVLTSPSDTDAPDTPLWRRRLGGSSTWSIDYADIREDRVIFYGNVSSELTEVTYKVRATNVGTFVVPAAYGEAMYEHRVFARSAGGSFKVVPAAQ